LANDIAALLTKKVFSDCSGSIGLASQIKPDYFQYTFQQLAQTQNNFRYTRIQNNILGHSMGGMIATRFALMYPSNGEINLENL
jgi:pimeloyl-ACP methyl ester carboxylesterase